MDCIFCKITSREIPCAKVYEDNDTLAFLDIAPAAKGHTLVILKEHYENIKDIPEESLAKLIRTVKKLSTAILTMSDGVNIEQSNGKAANQVIPHIHFHIIPRHENDSLNVAHWKSLKYDEGEMETWKKRIKDAQHNV